MGRNLVNLLVQEKSERVADAFMSLVDEGKHKIAVADIGGGWTQLIDSHYATPPALASELSGILQARVVLAGIYEGSGDASLHVFDSGALTEGWEDDRAEDPAQKVQHAVEAMGVTTSLLSFQNTVRREGWRMVAKR